MLKGRKFCLSNLNATPINLRSIIKMKLVVTSDIYPDKHNISTLYVHIFTFTQCTSVVPFDHYQERPKYVVGKYINERTVLRYRVCPDLNRSRLTSTTG